MIVVSDDAIMTAKDLSDALGCTLRTAKDYIRQNGGTRICGEWVLLGADLKSRLLNASTAPARKSQSVPGGIERRSLT